MKLLLASQSPRRRQLLAQLGYPLECISLDVDEHVPDGIPAAEIAEMLACRKAAAFDLSTSNFQFPISDDIVLVAADTVVVLDNQPLGKPASRQQAIDMLHALSGRHHSVYTGVCLRPLTQTILPERQRTACDQRGAKQSCLSDSERPATNMEQSNQAITQSNNQTIKQSSNQAITHHFSERTDVYFRPLTDDEIIHYVDTYKPFDKAGAYGIQEWIGMIGISRIDGCYYNVMGLPLAALYSHLQTLL
jgi:septum formation protein